MTALTARITGLPWWGQVALAALAGATGALAHAPFDLAPFILVPLVAAGLIAHRARSATRAAWGGAALGFGYFAATLTWILEPFQVDAAVTGWMAPFALALLALGLGGFWAAALGFARWAGGGPVAFVASLAGVEMLRAYVLTGFPWATPPQALVDGLAGQGLALLGPHGMMLALTGGAALILHVRSSIVSAAVTVAATATILVPPQSAPSPMTPTIVRLIQPNAPQHEKWDPARIPIFVNRQIDYTAAGPVPDLVLLPETALPYVADNAQHVFDILAEAARGAPVVLGIQRRDAQNAYYNSLVMLNPQGQVTARYDKHHLVPFGEYMPAQWLFRHVNAGGLAARASGGYASGPGPRLLDLGPLGRALPLICYEVVFAHNVGGAPTRPTVLMNLTNDAWFGARSGPQQHLAQARMRAIEQGLPMLRAANTGISAVIDPKGRVLDALALNTAGYLDVALPAAAAPTAYARTGDAPYAILLLLTGVALVLRRSRARRAQGIDDDASAA
ncbi:apolipoprotein N-acyltransferase [uncultured Tateyamaria sp.]|uniref:apolipoprotein N-acyltransferase n=1 Tax=Tateyamaria sp. 1078 TaxID=3417464 RepID=UPI0026181BE9|nr:apolipoprotein N-acyltransferase [uncultured Tateyamaria sp.]